MSKLLDRYLHLEEDKLRDYFYWISERHNVFIRRFINKEEAPWTDDPIIRDFKFTNVYRELDTGTVYYNYKLLPRIDRFEGDPEEILLNTIFYRFFNKIGTMEAIPNQCIVYYPTKSINIEYLNGIRRSLYEKAQTDKIFTNAHMVNSLASWRIDHNFNTPDWAKDNKANRFMKSFEIFYNDISDYIGKLREAESLERCFSIICGCTAGIGAFVAYEIICDLLSSKTFCRSVFKDKWSINDWANSGPGSQQFIYEILPESKNFKSNNQFLEVLHILREEQDYWFNQFNIEFKGKPLDLRSIEHSTCETFKYIKTKYNGKRPRNNYSVVENKTRRDNYLDIIPKKYMKNFIR